MINQELKTDKIILDAWIKETDEDLLNYADEVRRERTNFDRLFRNFGPNYCFMAKKDLLLEGIQRRMKPQKQFRAKILYLTLG